MTPTPPAVPAQDEARACCAHLRITHATHTEPRDFPATADFPGGRHLVNVAEWWECLDCGLRFIPEPPARSPGAGEETRTKPPLQVVTRRDVMARIRTRWRHQYYVNHQWMPLARGSSQDIYAALMRLDIATASREQLDAIIGNDSWTDNLCAGCGADVEALVEIGTGDGEDGAPALCVACLTEARAALDGAP